MMVGVGGGRVPLSGGGAGADAERASGRTAHGSTSSPVIYTAILNNIKKPSRYTIYTNQAHSFLHSHFSTSIIKVNNQRFSIQLYLWAGNIVTEIMDR